MSAKQTELETADPRDVVDVDSIDMAEDGRTVYMWLRLADGRAALWDFKLGAPPGQDQRIRIVEGA